MPIFLFVCIKYAKYVEDSGKPDRYQPGPIQIISRRKACEYNDRSGLFPMHLDGAAACCVLPCQRLWRVEG